MKDAVAAALGLTVKAVRAASLGQLESICTEVRELIRATVQASGGHYGAPLGVVELAVSIHHVFDSPLDRIIWDTGHQAYAHKILTGRAVGFNCLRTAEGVSGFPSIRESEHDAFGSGHASTALAAAYGIAQSQSLRTSQHWVVPVVGDGALAGGPALEALNLIAERPDLRICPILNDNGFSIARCVGALSLRTEVSYRLLAGALGMSYIGPVDGHCVRDLVEALRRAQCTHAPFVHVLTKKGYGDTAAVADPERFHFCTGAGEGTPKPHSTGVSLQAVLLRTLLELAQGDARVKVITPGMAHGASLSGLRPHVPNQFADTGIGEASAITMAAGLAAAGDTPIVYIYSTFLHRAVDQLIHDVGCQALPVVLVVDRAQLAGEDGPTHHGIYDLAILATVPGMQVYGVTTASDLEAVLRAAVESRQGPMAIRIFKGQEIEPSEDVIRQCPEFRVRREGADVTIVAHGRIVSEALDASAILRHESISARVVEVIKLNPLSDQLLHTMTDWRGAVLVVEEVIPSGSIGIQLCGALARQAIEVQHLCVRDPLISHNSRSRQLDELSLSASKIADVAKRLFTRCGKR